MRLLLLTAHPGIRGPLPKLAPLMEQGLREAGCHVDTLPWSRHAEGESRLRKPFDRLADLLRVRRALATGRYDALLVNTTHNWPALLRDLPLMLGTQAFMGARVLQFHGSQVERLRLHGRLAFKALSRALVRRADALLVLSSEEAEAWRRFAPGTRVELVENPFVPSATPAAGGRAADAGDVASRVPSLLFVGRFVAEKGVFDLLQAVALLQAERPCRLTLCGFGPQERELREQIQTLGLQAVAEVAGYLTGDELTAAYDGADVFVLPSHSEGFPLVIPEAMSHGLPIVTTPIRGARDHLLEDVNALFVPAGRPQELAAALRRLIDDPSLRERMGAANRAAVARWAPAEVVPRYVQIIEETLRSKRRRDDRGAMQKLGEPAADGRSWPAVDVLGVRLDGVDREAAAEAVCSWAAAAESRVVICANVHMVMEAWDDWRFRAALAQADMGVLDGRPLFWVGRLSGRPASQVRGEDLTAEVCARAARLGLAVGLYGAEARTLSAARARLAEEHPGIRIVYAYSPPFRTLSAAEDSEQIEKMQAAGVQLLLVALGCPKQELWMVAHKGRIAAPMLGIGAVFDMLGGGHPAAPLWMQRAGLEWVYRLQREPRRLWRRYALHNSRFVVLAGRQLWQQRGAAHRGRMGS